MPKKTSNKSEYIKSIKNVSYMHNSDHMVGIKITTDKSEIMLSICDEESCCEKWDYSKVKDFNVKDLIGAKILSFKEKMCGKNDGEGPKRLELIIKVQKTNEKLDEIKLFVENNHNGYYPHTYHIKYPNVDDDGIL